MFDEEPDGDPHGECAAEIASLTAECETLRRDAARYRYLRENFASVGLHGIELNWDQPDPCDALDSRLDAFIDHALVAEARR